MKTSPRETEDVLGRKTNLVILSYFCVHKKVGVFFILLYRRECFTGKYTTRKIHKNYIRDSSGLFSIISHVSEFIDDVISVISLHNL